METPPPEQAKENVLSKLEDLIENYRENLNLKKIEKEIPVFFNIIEDIVKTYNDKTRILDLKNLFKILHFYETNKKEETGQLNYVLRKSIFIKKIITDVYKNTKRETSNSEYLSLIVDLLSCLEKKIEDIFEIDIKETADLSNEINTTIKIKAKLKRYKDIKLRKNIQKISKIVDYELLEYLYQI